MHGAPARVLAQHLGRNLRFKGSPLRDRLRSSMLADISAMLGLLDIEFGEIDR